jgi:hypothetical protein
MNLRQDNANRPAKTAGAIAEVAHWYLLHFSAQSRFQYHCGSIRYHPQGDKKTPNFRKNHPTGDIQNALLSINYVGISNIIDYLIKVIAKRGVL